MPFGRPTQRDQQRAIAYREWVGQRNPLAIGSVVLGIFSLLEFGAVPVFSLGAIGLGVAALKVSGFRVQGSDRSAPALDPEPRTLNPLHRPLGRRLAWAGIGLGALSFAIFVFVRSLPAGH